MPRKSLIKGLIRGSYTCTAIVLIFWLSADVNAVKPVMQNCSNCHTMHNSQNLQSMRLDGTRITGKGTGECLDCHAETRAVLLRMDCVGCHAQNPNGTQNIVSNIPQVSHNAQPVGNDLAGGNFRHVFFGNDDRGHNVHGFGANINVFDLGNNPPGYDQNFDPSSGRYDTTNDQIMCAGQNGCHGNRNQVSQILAMKGSHHGDDTALQFGGTFNEAAQGGGTGASNDITTVAKSYRFLYNVKGGEDTNWEATISATDHNEYKGDTTVTGRTGQSWAGIQTISDSCAECHGAYHATSGITAGTGNPWIRHPSDVALPATGEYAAYTSYGPQISTYGKILVPVARTTLSSSPQSSVSNGVVMCLSCHRSHASPYYKMLRWDYKNSTLATAISGCTLCHTSMN